MLTDETRRRIEQEQRRVDRLIDSFRVRHMNNTKWREVIEVVNELPELIRTVRVKFVDELQARETSPKQISIYDGWAEGWFGAFALREIEWLEIAHLHGGIDTAAGLAEVRRRLDGLGKLQLREADSGLRIIGYET